MENSEHTVLIVEDEPQLARLIEDYLHQASYQTSIIENGNDVIDAVKSNSPSLVLLDVMLPGKDGMLVCREIREFSDVPIIMVTARIEEIDRLLGLEIGADDYICKPFSPREVVARVRAVLRRSDANINTMNELVELNELSYKASIRGRELDLTAIEFQLMSILVAEPGRIFTREQLMDKIYRDHRVVSDRTIDSHVKKLRKKIGKVEEKQELIYSVYGVGYKFELN